METRKLGVIAGVGYIIIFFAAIFANFFALEAIKTAPLETVQNHGFMARAGIMAFMITVVFDVIVAWALNALYADHALTKLSTYFRMMHAAIMGVAIFGLVMAVNSDTAEEILQHVDTFNIIWLIGLFFFGAHLILLGKIIKKPRIIAAFLIVAGIAYMLDTTAHFMLEDYEQYADVFLAIVAIPSIVGEMALAVWLLIKGGKQ